MDPLSPTFTQNTNHREREVVLEAENIVKRFPGVLANDHVNLKLHRGEILALLGENGAGKSTLMNIVYGLYHPDEGVVRVKGEPIHFVSPREAIHSGIGMVHQHFQLIPVMSVAENVILGAEETVNQVEDQSGDQADSQAQKQKRKSKSKRIAVEDRGFAGALRLLWGFFWRAMGPVVAIFIGWLVAQLSLLLIFAIAPYVVSPEVQAYLDQVDRLGKASLNFRATMALSLYYPNHSTFVTALLLLPVVIGCIAAAVVVVMGYWYAKRTWRGTHLVAEHMAQPDSIIDAAIDLVSTLLLNQNRRRAAARVREISQKFGLEVDPDAIVENLPVGTQQRVEIVKALYRHADILILDEPTAVLTPQESRELFNIMKDLAAQGVSIIFITHKLKEVFAVADSIVVMRGGKVAGTALPGEATENSLAAMMVGREVILRVPKGEATPGAVVLSVSGISAKDSRGAVVLDQVAFEVRSGEVLGVAGVQGNGQTELVEVLTGLRSASAGVVSILDNEVEHASPRTITAMGTAHVPEDRLRHGMVKPFSVADNLILNRYYNAPFSTFPTWRTLPLAILAYAAVFGLAAIIGSVLRTQALWPLVRSTLGLAAISNPSQNNFPFILSMLVALIYIVAWVGLSIFITALLLNRIMQALTREKNKSTGGIAVNEPAIRENAARLVQEFDIRTPSINTNGGNLSGGNQQKMVVAREFSRNPRLLIASQPTRGIDVGSIEFIHRQIVQKRDEGAAVLLVSAELDEIMALSDRIAVMYKGHIIATVEAATATREQLGLLMAGITPEVSAATA